jgi:NADPH2:quinone reductase
MQAILLRQTGGPEVLVAEEVETPQPGPGEVRVRAEAIGVGRPDVLVRKGTYKWMPALPAIPGAELAGSVDQLGAGVDPALLGRRALVSARELSTRGGCYAQWICVPASALYLLPDSIDPVDAVSLPNFQLALALFRCNGGQPPRAILVPGAAGAVATALAQVGRSRGARTLGTASTPDKAAHARAFGFDEVLDSRAPALHERVMAATQGRGVDLAFDQLGGSSLVECIRSLAPMGMAVSYNVVTGPPSEDVFALLRALLGRSLAVRTFSMHTLDDDPTARRALMEEAIALMARGALKAPPAQRFPLARADQAHALQESGGALGKIVLLP